MIKQTQIADNIDVTDTEASYDSACKKLLSNKQILAWILKGTVQEFKDCEIREIAEKYIEGMPEVAKVLVHPGETNANITGMNNEDTVFKEGRITYDIRFQAVYPKSGELISLFINIEAQKDFYPGYSIIKRGIFYCSRMISAQYSTEFVEPNYNDISKVYSIWICLNPSQKAGNTIARYRMAKEDLIGTTEDKPMEYDLLSVITICLGGEGLENYNGILKLLDVLLSDSKKPEEKKKVLKEEYAIAMTKELEEEVNIMCNLGQGVLEKGMEKGIEKGIEKGMEKGMKEKTQDIVKNMLEMDMDIATIMKATRLTREEVEAIRDRINVAK